MQKNQEILMEKLSEWLGRRLPLSKEQLEIYLQDIVKLNSLLQPTTFLLPHPKQLEFLQSPSRIRALFWGNKSGKSDITSLDDLLLALEKHPYRPNVREKGVDRGTRSPEDPITIWIVALDSDVGRRGMERKVLTHLRKYFPQEKYKLYNQEHRIHFSDHNSNIKFMSCDSGWEKFTGDDVDHVNIDEEPPDKRVLDECRMRTLAYKGSIAIDLTPLWGLSYMYDDYYTPFHQKRRTPLDLWVSNASMYDNPFLDEKEIKNAEEGMGEKERQIRVYGNFVTFEGLVYDEFSRAVHLVKPFSIPSTWSVYRGVDWGYTNPFACEWLAIDPSAGNIYAFDEVYEKGLIPTFAKPLIMSKSLSHPPAYMTYADPEDPAAIEEFRLGGGIPPLGGCRDVRGRTFRMKSLLDPHRPRFFVMEGRCPHLVEEFERHRWKKIPRD